MMLVFEKNTESVSPRLTNMPVIYPNIADVTNNMDLIERFYAIAVNTDLLGFTINEKQLHEFLSRNMDVFLTIPDMVRKVTDVIGNYVIPDLEIINDEEIHDQDRLAMIFKIKNKSYEEILNMWDSVSKKAYKNIDDSISKKMAIILDGE